MSRGMKLALASVLVIAGALLSVLYLRSRRLLNADELAALSRDLDALRAEAADYACGAEGGDEALLLATLDGLDACFLALEELPLPEQGVHQTPPGDWIVAPYSRIHRYPYLPRAQDPADDLLDGVCAGLEALWRFGDEAMCSPFRPTEVFDDEELARRDATRARLYGVLQGAELSASRAWRGGHRDQALRLLERAANLVISLRRGASYVRRTSRFLEEQLARRYLSFLMFDPGFADVATSRHAQAVHALGSPTEDFGVLWRFAPLIDRPLAPLFEEARAVYDYPWFEFERVHIFAFRELRRIEVWVNAFPQACADAPTLENCRPNAERRGPERTFLDQLLGVRRHREAWHEDALRLLRFEYESAETWERAHRIQWRVRAEQLLNLRRQPCRAREGAPGTLSTVTLMLEDRPLSVPFLCDGRP